MDTPKYQYFHKTTEIDIRFHPNFKEWVISHDPIQKGIIYRSLESFMREQPSRKILFDIKDTISDQLLTELHDKYPLVKICYSLRHAPIETYHPVMFKSDALKVNEQRLKGKIKAIPHIIYNKFNRLDFEHGVWNVPLDINWSQYNGKIPTICVYK